MCQQWKSNIWEVVFSSDAVYEDDRCSLNSVSSVFEPPNQCLSVFQYCNMVGIIWHFGPYLSISQCLVERSHINISCRRLCWIERCLMYCVSHCVMCVTLFLEGLRARWGLWHHCKCVLVGRHWFCCYLLLLWVAYLKTARVLLRFYNTRLWIESNGFLNGWISKVDSALDRAFFWVFISLAFTANIKWSKTLSVCCTKFNLLLHSFFSCPGLSWYHLQ